jgi:hypothetical protein
MQCPNAFSLSQVDPISGEFTGPDVTFVYPDFRTGIGGTFHKGVLVHGVEVEITATRCRPGFREIQTTVKKYLILYTRDTKYLRM